MTSKKPQLAPNVEKPTNLPRPTGAPPPRVQPDRCATCDSMQRRILRLEEALREIRTLSDIDAVDAEHHPDLTATIHDRATDAILGR